MIRERDEYLIKVEEFLEARILEDGIVKETFHFGPGNTIFNVCKHELAQLVGGIDNKTVNRIWAKIDGVLTEKTTFNKNNDYMLEVETSSPYTVSGNYTAILTGNSSIGTVDPYNSISVDITLTAGCELDFTMIYSFSGISAGWWGEQVSVCRLGNAQYCEDYNYPIATVALRLDGTIQQWRSAANTVSAGSKTLRVSHATAFSGPITFNSVAYYTSCPNDFYAAFERFTGFTITMPSGQDFFFDCDFIFG